jgi:hypothetical protein
MLFTIFANNYTKEKRRGRKRKEEERSLRREEKRSAEKILDEV